MEWEGARRKGRREVEEYDGANHHRPEINYPVFAICGADPQKAENALVKRRLEENIGGREKEKEELRW